MRLKEEKRNTLEKNIKIYVRIQEHQDIKLKIFSEYLLRTFRLQFFFELPKNPVFSLR